MAQEAQIVRIVTKKLSSLLLLALNVALSCLELTTYEQSGLLVSG